MSLGPIDSPWVANGGLNLRVAAADGSGFVSRHGDRGTRAGAGGAARRPRFRPAGDGPLRSGGARRATRVLVAAQVALAVTLLVMAGLVTRTLIAIERLEPGFDMNNLLTASVTRPEGAPLNSGRLDRACRRRARGSFPAWSSAGATSRLPFAGSRFNPNRGLQIEGQPLTDATSGRWAVDYVVTPALLETLRVRRVDGRGFTDADGAGAPLVAIINQTMARRFWPEAAPSARAFDSRTTRKGSGAP